MTRNIQSVESRIAKYEEKLAELKQEKEEVREELNAAPEGKVHPHRVEFRAILDEIQHVEEAIRDFEHIQRNS